MERKGLIWLEVPSPSSEEPRLGAQERNLETESRADIVEEYHLLAYLSSILK